MMFFQENDVHPKKIHFYINILNVASENEAKTYHQLRRTESYIWYMDHVIDNLPQKYSKVPL